MKRSTRQTDRRAVEERLARAFCEDPEPFHIFSSSDGLAARVKANRKGLVAVFLGESKKWNLEGKTHNFLAIPSGLAERMVSGAFFALDNENWQVKVVLLMLRKWMTEHVGRKTRLQLTDAETVRDVERQLYYILTGEWTTCAPAC